MSDPDRHETARRIARDDGDPDDAVWLTTAGRQNRSRYHDDPDCSRLTAVREVERWTREKAKAWGRPPCKHCVLDDVVRVREQRTPLRRLLANGGVPDRAGLRIAAQLVTAVGVGIGIYAGARLILPPLGSTALALIVFGFALYLAAEAHDKQEDGS